MCGKSVSGAGSGGGRSRLIPDYGDPRDPDVRARYGYLEAGVSVAGNALLFVFKLFLGLLINSIALIADAVHTLSDVGTSAVVVLGFRASKKPPDEGHPYGHGRMEHIATVVIAVLLVITGLTFVEQSLERLWGGAGLRRQDLAMAIGAAVMVSAVAKELMASYSMAIGRRIDSDVLVADAWHHRSDALASVVVGLGIMGSSMGYRWIDPVFGVLVSLIIIKVGVDLFRRSSDRLMGQAPGKDEMDHIRKLASDIQGIEGIHDVSVHDYGSTRVVSMHARMPAGMKLEDAHRLSDRLSDEVERELSCTTIVHLDPSGDAGGRDVAEMVGRIAGSDPDIVSFHKVRVSSGPRGYDIRLHAVVPMEMSVRDSHRLEHRLGRALRREAGGAGVDIHIEPCDGDCPGCPRPCSGYDPGGRRVKGSPGRKTE